MSFSLLTAEAFVRIFLPCPDYGGGIRPAFYSGLFEYDALLGWKGVPNLTTPYYSKDFRITVSHDALGYRNISPPYRDDRKNHLLLGDSYAWGWGVEDHETATAVFNRQQATHHLYSLGIAGYGTDQEYLALQQHLQRHPDKTYDSVTLLFYMNDLDDIASAERYGYPKPFFLPGTDDQLPILQNMPVPEKTVAQNIPVSEKPEPDSWRQQSQLMNFFDIAIQQLVSSLRDRQKPAEDGQLAGNEWQNLQLATQLLSAINRLSKEKNMSFHVIFLMTQDTPPHQKTNSVNLQSY